MSFEVLSSVGTGIKITVSCNVTASSSVDKNLTAVRPSETSGPGLRTTRCLVLILIITFSFERCVADWRAMVFETFPEDSVFVIVVPERGWDGAYWKKTVLFVIFMLHLTTLSVADAM